MRQQKVYQMMGVRLILKHWLRHFANPDVILRRVWGLKYGQNFRSKSNLSRRRLEVGQLI